MPSSRSASRTSRASDTAGTGHRGALAGAWVRKVALAPLLVAQALQTRRRALVLPEPEGARTGVAGSRDRDGPGRALHILVAGDSSAAGVGVAHQRDALAARMASALHARLLRPVRWTLRARTGLTTAGVAALLRAEPLPPVDVALVVSGVNDVVGLVSRRKALAARGALVEHLVGTGLARHVAFAPLPPIDRFPLLPEPLRSVLGADARHHDAALRDWAAGRSDVSYADCGFDLDGGMADDGFHPGAPVYRAIAAALSAHLAAVVHGWDQAPAAGSGG